MKAFVRRLIAATLPALSAATLFAGSAPAHAELKLPPVDPFQECLNSGRTPNECAALLNPTPAPSSGVKPATTRVSRITNVRGNASAISPSQLGVPVQLIRSR